MVMPRDLTLLVFFGTPHRDLPSSSAIGGGLFYPTDLPVRDFAVGNPVLNGVGQFTGALPVMHFSDEEVVAFQSPVDICLTARAAIGSQDGAFSLIFRQIQHLFCRLDQVLKTSVELTFAWIQAFRHQFVIARRQHAAQLSSPALTLMGKVTFGGAFRLGPRDQTG